MDHQTQAHYANYMTFVRGCLVSDITGSSPLCGWVTYAITQLWISCSFDLFYNFHWWQIFIAIHLQKKPIVTVRDFHRAPTTTGNLVWLKPT